MKTNDIIIIIEEENDESAAMIDFDITDIGDQKIQKFSWVQASEESTYLLLRFKPLNNPRNILMFKPQTNPQKYAYVQT